MRLVDVESAPADSSDVDSPTARPAPKSASARTTSKTAAAIRLHPLAKLFNLSLNLLFVPVAKILCTSLRSGNAYRFSRRIRAATVERQAAQFRPVLIRIVCPARCGAGV